MAVLAIAIAMLFLGAVSAADTDVDANLTDIDNSLEVSELNGGSDIDEVTTEDDSVDVANENEDVLTASDEEKLEVADGANVQISEASTHNQGTIAGYTVGQQIDIDWSWTSMSGTTWTLYINDVATDITVSSSYWSSSTLDTWESGDISYTVTEAKKYTFQLKYYSTYSGESYNSNVLTFDVVPATQETATSIEINPTTVKPGNNIQITPTVIRTDTNQPITEGNIEIWINDILNDTISAGSSLTYSNTIEDTYTVYAKYLGNDDFTDSVSDSKKFLINQDDSLTFTETLISLNTSSIAPEGSIAVTPIVKNSTGHDISGYVDLYEVGNDDPIVSNIAIGSPYVYTPEKTSGTYQIYAKYLGNADLKYASSVSSKSEYKVKQKLNIDLTANNLLELNITPSSYGSVSVTFKAISNISPELELYLNDELWSTKISEGSNSLTINFDSSDWGENEVYVKFVGDDDYLESFSNTVRVNVFQSVSVTPTVTFNSTSAIEGDKILVTVTANNNAPGTITIYSDSSYSNEIATLNVGDSYEYIVPEADTTSSSYTSYIYAYYNEYTDAENYKVYSRSSTYKYFTAIKRNSLTLTGDDLTGDIEINLGESITLKADIDYWTQRQGYDSNYNRVYYSDIEIYLDNEKIGEFDVTRTSSGYSYVYSISNYTIDFNSESDVGIHTIYAVYKGYSESYGSSYAPATSNTINVNVLGSSQKQDIILNVDIDSFEDEGDYYSYYSDEVSFTTTSTSDISGEIIYKEGDVILGKADVGEEFAISNLTVGEHNITAYWAGDDAYNEANRTFTITINKKSIWYNLNIDDVVYPDHAVGEFSSNVIGTYTITINGTDYVVVYDNEYEESVQFDINQLPVGEYEVTNVVFSGDMANYDIDFEEEVYNDLPLFEVLSSTPTYIYAEIEGSNTIKKGESLVIIVTVENALTYDEINVGNVLLYDDNNAEIAIIDLSKTNNYTFTPTYSVSEDSYKLYAKYLGHEELNYNESELDEDEYLVYWIEASELNTSVSLELSQNEITPTGVIVITPKVTDENGDEVTVGTVEIYDTQYYQYADPVARINAGESANFTDDTYNPGTVASLYAIYKGFTGTDVIYNPSELSEKASYTRVQSNTVTLTVNGETEITIEDGVSFDVKAVLTGGDGTITLYVDGIENTTLINGESKSMTLPVKTYKLYAEYARGTDTYTSATSNEVTVNVIQKTVKEIVVSVESVTLPSSVQINVTANVDGIYTIDVNGSEVNVSVNGGRGSQYISLTAGSYYANVTGQEGATITNAVFTVYPEAEIGKLIIRDFNNPENATIALEGEGNVTISLEYFVEKILDSPQINQIIFNIGGNVKYVYDPTYGQYTGAFSFVINQTADFTVNATYQVWGLGENEYKIQSNVLTYSIVITSPAKKDITLNVEVDGEQEDDNLYDGDWTDSYEIVTRSSEDIEGVIIYKKGDVELGRANIGETFEINASSLGLGKHEITAVFEGNDSYNGANATFTIDIAKKIIWFTLEIDDVTYPDHAVGKLYAEDVDGKYTITINGTEYEVEFVWSDVDEPVTFDINQLPAGTYTVTGIRYEDMEHYEFGESEIQGQNTLPTFTVNSTETVLDDTVLSAVNGTVPTFTINLPGATGNLTVKVGNKTYTKELSDGKATVEITDLPAGEYSANVTYTGDNNHKESIIPVTFTVDEKNKVSEDALNVNVPSDSTIPIFSIDLPGATGNLTVKVGNKTYTKELSDGKASISIEDLTPGSHNVTVTYTGDAKHLGISKNATVTIPTPVLKGSNVNAIYSANANYKVRVTVNGKAIVGEKVTIKFNGKTYEITTDKDGYATLKLTTALKVKSYNINVEFKGVKTTNKLTVKQLIKAKNLKVKKSKKVLKIKVTSNKVNGKFLKGKKLKLKIKGKTIKAKINKKGVVTFKVKRNILKKLKVGKTYKYTVSYGKDSLTKKIKVKR